MSQIEKYKKPIVYDLEAEDTEVSAASLTSGSAERNRTLITMMLDSYKRKIEKKIEEECEKKIRDEYSRKLEVEMIRHSYEALQFEREKIRVKQLQEQIETIQEKKNETDTKLHALQEEKSFLEERIKSLADRQSSQETRADEQQSDNRQMTEILDRLHALEKSKVRQTAVSQADGDGMLSAHKEKAVRANQSTVKESNAPYFAARNSEYDMLPVTVYDVGRGDDKEQLVKELHSLKQEIYSLARTVQKAHTQIDEEVLRRLHVENENQVLETEVKSYVNSLADMKLVLASEKERIRLLTQEKEDLKRCLEIARKALRVDQRLEGME